MNVPDITKRPNVFNLALTGFLTISLVLTAVTVSSVRSLESEAKGGNFAQEASISINQPFDTIQLGSTINFTTTIPRLAGWEYPMIAVSCYQDVDGDGTTNTNLLGPDVVYTWLDHPDASFLIGAYSSLWTLRGGGPAECRADLDAYGWKGGKQSTRVLTSVSFHSAGQ